MTRSTRNVYKTLRLVLLLFFAGCSDRLPVSDFARTPSVAITQKDTQNTAIGRLLKQEIDAHGGESGFHLLPASQDAFLMRISLVQAAERSVDLQYFSVRNDTTGKLLLEAILHAADRGVRVRMLLDDWNLKDFESGVEALNTHPNIEIRVFNPFATENQSALSSMGNYFTRFDQFARRMHNKALIADNQMAIMGGRNLGDEYFGAGSDFNFRDMDVLAAGPIVEKISGNFDKFWNSKEVYPLLALSIPKPDTNKVAQIRQELQLHWEEVMKSPMGTYLHESPAIMQLKKKETSLIWAPAEFSADSPYKIEKPENMTRSKPEKRIDKLADNAHHEFIIVSPYFVPLESGTRWLDSLARQGVSVRILTNSLSSTDMVIAYAGYSHYREALVASGVNLYELKAIGGKPPHHIFKGSSSQNSLHAKFYIIDRRDLIIGSFNMDPRSIEYNTEQVLVIHSKALAQSAAETFERTILPSTSFHVMLANGTLPSPAQTRNMDPLLSVDPGQHLIWVAEQDGKKVQYDYEPDAGFRRQFIGILFSGFPIDDDL